MTAEDARKLVAHRFDSVIKNIDQCITEAALHGKYTYDLHIYYGCYNHEDYIKYIKEYYESQGFSIIYDNLCGNNDIFHISWEPLN